MLNKYKKYLVKLDKKLAKFFEDQKDFIKCRSGCSICCSNSTYSTSVLEYAYVKKGMIATFSPEMIKLVKNKAMELLEEKNKLLQEQKDVPYMYKCPFLIENKCSIYNFRPLICRTFGLLFSNSMIPGSIFIPGCFEEGLNYSGFIDKETHSFIHENIVKQGITTKPKVYRYDDLFEGAGGIQFMNYKPLMDWLAFDESLNIQ